MPSGGAISLPRSPNVTGSPPPIWRSVTHVILLPKVSLAERLAFVLEQVGMS